MRKVFAWVIVLVVCLLLVGCLEADVASRNLSTEADQFRVTRRIVFYNGITDSYILVIEGKCSLGNNDAPGELTVTCKIGEEKYAKHFLGLSDNVTYFAEQIEPISVDPYQYTVIFKPLTIIPDIEIQVP